MSLLPPRDNSYRGSRLAIAIVGLQIAIDFVRGSIHVFWADSGAGRIAGIDLSTNGAPVVSLLAAIGLDQLAWALIELGIVLRYRRWIPVLLATLLARQVAVAWLLWLWKPLGVEAPGRLGALAGIPLLALALSLALRPASRPVGPGSA